MDVNNKKPMMRSLGAALLSVASTMGWAAADTLPIPAQNTPAIGGLVARVDGEPVGALVGYLDGLALVDLAATAATSGTVLVAQAASLGSAPLLELLSPKGYIFHVSTGSLEMTGLAEGELQRALVIFYDSPNCGGQPYLPLQNESGRFGVPNFGDGRLRPLISWVARQGYVFRSPDPADSTPVYMVRRGTNVEEVFLRSFRVFAPAMNPPGAVCVTPPLTPAYDLAVRVEPLEPDVAGVAGTLGGEISVGR